MTKITLGAFGCVPAFDTYFKKGFGVWTFGRKALGRVAGFYTENAEAIERHRVSTIDFTTGEPTQRNSHAHADVVEAAEDGDLRRLAVGNRESGRNVSRPFCGPATARSRRWCSAR